MGKIRQVSAEEIERTLALIFGQELEKAFPSLRLSSEHRTIAKDKINSLTKGTFRPLYFNAIEQITLFSDRFRDPLLYGWASRYPPGICLRDRGFYPKGRNYPHLLPHFPNPGQRGSYPRSGARGNSLIHGEIIPTGSIPELTEAVRRSFLYHKLLLDGTYSTVKDLTQSLGFSDTKQTCKILKLRILAADILTRILKNQVPTHWTFSLLLQACEYPDWARQRTFLA